MNISLAEGAKLAGISKSALYKAIRRGVLSGVRDELTGEWRVDISELERLYPLNAPAASDTGPSAPDHSPARKTPEADHGHVHGLERQIELLISERDFLRQQLADASATIQRISALLTGPRPTADSPMRIPRPLWFLLALGVVGLVVLAWVIGMKG